MLMARTFYSGLAQDGIQQALNASRIQMIKT